MTLSPQNKRFKGLIKDSVYFVHEDDDSLLCVDDRTFYKWAVNLQ